jgi:uncharacterized membrane protein
MGFGIVDLPNQSIEFFAGIGFVDTITIVYPVLPWWAMMALGWGFGRYLLQHPPGSATRSRPVARLLLVWGGVALVVFGVLRGLNAYGNMRLWRLDSTWVQWLHVGKYPPSITFTALELGLLALILSALFRWQHILVERASVRNPILVFGQTAFFFYIAHIFLLEVSTRSLGMHQQHGLLASLAATILVVAVLYPVCLWYRRYKTTHPRSWVRFI